MKETLLRCVVGFVSMLLCITLIATSIWLVVNFPVFLLMFASIGISVLSYFIGWEIISLIENIKTKKKG